MTETPQGINDPATYRAMREPFPDSATADAALEAFAKDLREIRIRHRIAEVYCIVSVNLMTEDVGDSDSGETSHIARFQHGDQLKAPILAAYAFGAEEAERKSLLENIVAQAAKNARKKKA